MYWSTLSSFVHQREVVVFFSWTYDGFEFFLSSCLWLFVFVRHYCLTKCFPRHTSIKGGEPSSQFEQLVCLVQIELFADVSQSLISRFALSFLLRLDKKKINVFDTVRSIWLLVWAAEVPKLGIFGIFGKLRSVTLILNKVLWVCADLIIWID